MAYSILKNSMEAPKICNFINKLETFLNSKTVLTRKIIVQVPKDLDNHFSG